MIRHNMLYQYVGCYSKDNVMFKISYFEYFVLTSPLNIFPDLSSLFHYR